METPNPTNPTNPVIIAPQWDGNTPNFPVYVTNQTVIIAPQWDGNPYALKWVGVQVGLSSSHHSGMETSFSVLLQQHTY